MYPPVWKLHNPYCPNRHRCHGSWLKIVLKSTSHKKCCFFSACTRKKFWQNKSFLYLGNQPSGTYIMRWLTVAKKIYPNVCLCGEQKCENEWQPLQSILYSSFLLHFVAFFPCSLTVFHRSRQLKSSRAGQQNNFLIFQPYFNVEIPPKNATKCPVA